MNLYELTIDRGADHWSWILEAPSPDDPFTIPPALHTFAMQQGAFYLYGAVVPYVLITVSRHRPVTVGADGRVYPARSDVMWTTVLELEGVAL